MKETEYKFLKIKNGKPFFGIVSLEITKCESISEIIEEYNGNGFTSQGTLESVPKKGYENWKLAIRNGLEFTISESNENWKVKIKDVIGRIATDTNPTIIGSGAILAFCEQTKLELNPDLKKEIDNFVFNSWENGNDEKIPNFTKLNYEK
jgi:hypothetical protein